MVVVLPEPLTPTTRMMCGRGKAVISSGFGDGGEYAFDLVGHDAADFAFGRAAFEFGVGKPIADAAAVAGPRSEAISASSTSSSDCGVERGRGDHGRQIFGDPLGGLLEPAEQPFAPSCSCGFGDQARAVAAGQADERSVLGVTGAVRRALAKSGR